MRYEYYIHYFGVDRRNDRWVNEQCSKSDPEEIKRQLKAIDLEEEQKKVKAQLGKEQS